ncbi:glutamine amidotransferase domain protein [Mycobacterium phage Raela]|uniref:Glutamine amidotransferase domain protein n=1 Tax=Mycobacterium phage Raela TaxID=2499054 RepID=A0A3S9U9C5_9CAUD|nr:glutamine amidotransferase domain protein [Mycobacterium phage Raela]
MPFIDTAERDCDNCGATINIDHEIYYECDECGHYYRCESCGECDYHDDDYYGSRSEYNVHEWNWRPSRLVFKGDRSQPMFGVELEVGGYESDIAPVVTSIDASESHLYMKHDGSIDGVEIVSHPMTLAWARGFNFDGLLRGLEGSGAYVEDGYGYHIHVSRESFRRGKVRTVAPHQMTWLMFIYRNAENLKLLARRDSSQWASFRAPRYGELARKAVQPDTSDTRYVAVNCQNAATYELRFFAATLDPTEFYAALEFAHASVEYTRKLTTRDVLTGNALEWRTFSDWVARRGDMHHLEAELDRIGPDTVPTAKGLPLRVRIRHANPLPGDWMFGPMALPDAIAYAGHGGQVIRGGSRYWVEENPGTEPTLVNVYDENERHSTSWFSTSRWYVTRSDVTSTLEAYESVQAGNDILLPSQRTFRAMWVPAVRRHNNECDCGECIEHSMSMSGYYHY